MKITKEEFEKDILILADQMNLKTNFKGLLDVYKGLPKICEMLVYDLFVNNFENILYDLEENDVIKAYYHLKNYCQELKENGFVEFKN